jgi:hypothetical protein
MTDYYTLWAHQIKTPIAAMHLLLQQGAAEKNAELSVELFKIEQYVEMVLSYLRLGSESSDYVLKAYSLDGIIRKPCESMRGCSFRKGYPSASRRRTSGVDR